MQKYDYLIVGCGLSGAVIANKLKQNGKNVLIIDKRNHIGGNIYTELVDNIHIHKYGPHIFHTNKKEIWNYMNQFDDFQHFTLQTIAKAEDGKIYNLPFNLHTFYQVYGVTTEQEVDALLKEFNNIEVKNVEDFAISKIGEKMYKLLVKGYTEKQWNTPCSEVSPEIIKRLPIRKEWNNNYFNDEYQGIPKNGYTKVIENMIKDIDVELNTPFVLNKHYEIAEKIIYCGSIDELLDFKYGVLPYRSLEFKEYHNEIESQNVPIVNYTSREVPYTRSIDHKMFLNNTKNERNTIITHEYPKTFDMVNERYYPIEIKENVELYEKYLSLLKEKYPKIIPCGRLGLYKYLDMDKVVERSIELVKLI